MKTFWPSSVSARKTFRSSSVVLHIDWTDEARADIRALDRDTAMRVYDGLYRFAVTGAGDVKAVQGKHAGKLRLRLDYRLFFRPDGQLLRILAVKNRKESYRRFVVAWRTNTGHKQEVPD